MYHPSVVAKNIRDWELKNNFKLTRHPVDKVRFYVEHFERLTVREPKKNRPTGFSRGLLQDEIDFIRNEQALCMLDFSYEVERYEFVEDVITSELRLVTLNNAQRVAMEIIADLELRGMPIILLFLKARQLGVSTLFAWIIKHRMEFIKFTKGVVASGDEEKTRLLVEKMIEKPHGLLPWWLTRSDVRFNHSGDEFMLVPSADSTLLVQHGRQELGIARGNTANTWHFTELLEWLDPKSLIEAGFNKAVHPSARTFGVEETTASNRGAWLHKHWEDCMTKWPEGRSMILPVFLPYFIGEDIYPPPGYFPIVEGWNPSALVQAHAMACEKYVRTSPILSKVLGSDWKMSRRQQWWYENEYKNAVEDPESFAKFLAECPADPISAFQSHSRSIFDAVKLQMLQNELKPLFTDPILISGPEIPQVSMPQTEPAIMEIGYENNGLERKWNLHYAQGFTNVEECKQPQHKLWIWELPKENHKYVVAVDCSEGIGRDRTVIQVIRVGTSLFPAFQVAEYASDSASAFDIVGLVLMLLCWYSPKRYDGQVNMAMLAPEEAADGKTLINEARKWGWPNIYVRQMPENRAKGPADGTLLGWRTDQSTRPTLINWMMKFIKERRIQINSPWLLDELRSFVVTEKKSQTSSTVTYKIQHDRDSHDDRLFALAIGIVCGHGINIYEDIASSHWAGVAKSQQIEIPQHNYKFGIELPKPELDVPEMVHQKALPELEF